MDKSTQIVLFGFVVAVVSALLFYGSDSFQLREMIAMLGSMFGFWLMGLATGYGKDKDGKKNSI